MKKRLLLPLLCAGLWASPAIAQPYVSVSGGLSLLNNSDVTSTATGVVNPLLNPVDYKAGFLVGGAVGYRFDSARVEGAINYQRDDVDTNAGVVAAANSDASIWSFMGNGYYDFSIEDSSISPYLTAGLGLAVVTSRTAAVDIVDKSAFAWQVGAGVGIKASEQVIVDLGYRYFRTADVTNKVGTSDYSVGGSNILAGVRYNF